MSEVAVKTRVKRRKRSVMPRIKINYFKKAKSPIELFGILKGKIFYESDEILFN